MREGEEKVEGCAGEEMQRSKDWREKGWNGREDK